jgi:hypothetical protein
MANGNGNDPIKSIYKSVVRNFRKAYVEPQGTPMEVALAKTPEEMARKILKDRGIDFKTTY